jgi:phosphoglycerate kinase
MRRNSLAASVSSIPRNQLRGQRILVRIDAEDDATLRDSIATLSFLSQSGARVLAAADSNHQISRRLAEWLGRPVNQIEDWKSDRGLHASTHLREGGIAFISNLAHEPGEWAADDTLADALSYVCDIYCNEAFALSHQIRASTVGVATKAQQAVAGLAFDRELRAIQRILRQPRKPLVSILGGELSIGKLLLAEEIARRSDRTFIAGQLVFPFLAAKGLGFSGPPVSDRMIRIAERMLTEARDSKRFLFTPDDFIVVHESKFERLARGEYFPLKPPTQTITEAGIQPDHVIGDIGEVTRWRWKDTFGLARTIFWHGPVGITELELFRDGSRFLSGEIARYSGDHVSRSYVCGRSLTAAIRSFGFSTETIGHLTPAGRTALQYFAGGLLPAVEALSRPALLKSFLLERAG